MSKQQEEKLDENLNQQEEVAKEEAVQEDILQQEYDKLKADFDALKDAYIRANADFENFKKRLEKDKATALAYAHESFAKDLLPVLDALGLAAQFDADDEFVKKLKEGILNTIKLFEATFKKYGVEEIKADKDFDPNLHEAMMIVESEEHQSGEIVSEFVKGYTIKDRVLRPSKVSVAK